MWLATAALSLAGFAASYPLFVLSYRLMTQTAADVPLFTSLAACFRQTMQLQGTNHVLQTV
jgi:hypothetical protein